jgi:hypothetical protein
VSKIAKNEGPRINDEITARTCRLIGVDGSQLGLFGVSDAQRIADEQTHILRHCVPGRLHGIQQFSCRAPGIPASAGDMTDQARLASGAVHRQKFRCSPQKDKYASRHENFLFPV